MVIAQEPLGSSSVLGPADVDEETLARMVAASLGVDAVTLTSATAEPVDYDLEALTTAGRYWVRGTAHHQRVPVSWAFFVKVVQSWTRTAAFDQVPPHLRAIAAAGLPWRTEPAVYRSDLGRRLPDGLSLPLAHAVIDLDDESAAMWLDVVDVDAAPWDTARFERAAQLLGRLAASAHVRPLRSLGKSDVVRSYVHGRVEHQVAPALRSDELWQHPVVAEAFDPALRARILGALDALPELTAELDTALLGTAHGDACARNLLVPRSAPETFVLIDYGFWCEAPLGFDLSQLLLGEVQVGERPASELPRLEELCLGAYVAGLHEEGVDVSEAQVRRWHALLMLIFTGLSAVPLEVHFGRPAPGPAQVIAERAEACRFILDLVDSTAGMPV